MKTLWAVISALTMVLTMPIWFFLLHELLKATNADRLEWFLFWAYVPLSFLLNLALALFRNSKE